MSDIFSIVSAPSSKFPFEHQLRSYHFPIIIPSPLPLSRVTLCYFCTPTASVGSSLPYVTIHSGFFVPCKVNKNSLSHITLFEPFSHSVKKDFVIPFYSSQKSGDLLNVPQLRSHRVWVFGIRGPLCDNGHWSLRTGKCLRHPHVPASSRLGDLYKEHLERCLGWVGFISSCENSDLD